MFSDRQLKNFAPKRRIEQSTFDEAVKENLNEFAMEVGIFGIFVFCFFLYRVLLICINVYTLYTAVYPNAKPLEET
jgi:hypothetical protein